MTRLRHAASQRKRISKQTGKTPRKLPKAKPEPEPISPEILEEGYQMLIESLKPKKRPRKSSS